MYSMARSRAHAQRRFQLNAFPVALAAHVREMFRLAGIDREILRARIFAHDHAGINLFLRRR